MIRNMQGQFQSADCPECGNGTFQFYPFIYMDFKSDHGMWECDGLADPEDENKPLVACQYSVEGIEHERT